MKKNRLANEVSPYLQQHAGNPVDWYAWGPEALAEAKSSDRPILLSIGYSACHWCHVMERESFENAATAKLMNELFVNIKVDREERPDLDHVYQMVVQVMGRSGGWPLTVFLTPDQKPFFAGTYFPPVEKYGMPSFSDILRAVSDGYKTKRGEIEEQATNISGAIARTTTPPAGSDDPFNRPASELLANATKQLARAFDDLNGGFGRYPKFPHTMALDVLVRRGALDEDKIALARASRALQAMRRGGIQDHLGGGFHRYSTDDRWLVPHFEKMLYDNALLLRLYVDAYRATGEEAFRYTACRLASYVLREMTSPEGGFFATQDADSEGEEGTFFVWSRAEIFEALGNNEKLTALVCRYFGVTNDGNFEKSGKSVLHEAMSVDDAAAMSSMPVDEARHAIEKASAILFDARAKRETPFRDEKIMASWNGLMIASLAEAGVALRLPELVRAAERAFAYIEQRLVARGDAGHLRIARHALGATTKGAGFLDDYAFMAFGALHLYEATGEPKYAIFAREIADSVILLFWDREDDGFFFSPSDGEALIHRAKDPYDNAIPSGASMMCEVLMRLGSLVGGEYLAFAEKQMRRVAAIANDNPAAFGQMVCAIDRHVRGSVDVVIVGSRTDERAKRLADAVFTSYVPHRLVAWVDPSDEKSLKACSEMASGKSMSTRPVAYVCRNRSCSPPVDDAAMLRELLVD